MVFCAGQLAGGNVCPLRKVDVAEESAYALRGGDDEEAEEVRDTHYVFTDEDAHIKYWFPVLTGFSEVVSHPHIDVRTVYASAHHMTTHDDATKLTFFPFTQRAGAFVRGVEGVRHHVHVEPLEPCFQGRHFAHIYWRPRHRQREESRQRGTTLPTLRPSPSHRKCYGRRYANIVIIVISLSLFVRLRAPADIAG
jgi:hypothetical protein